MDKQITAFILDLDSNPDLRLQEMVATSVERLDDERLVLQKVDHVADLSPLKANDLLIVLASQVSPLELGLEAFFTHEKCLLIVDEKHGDAIRWLRRHPKLNHLIVHSGIVSPWQLITWLRKSVSGYLWGVQQYLKAGTEVHRLQIERFSKKHDCLQLLRKTLSATPGFSDLPHIAATMASEMIMNAVFSAPIDRDTGESKYALRNRGEDLLLQEGEHAVFTFGHDDEVLAISVTDSFGRLSKDVVLSSWQNQGALQPNDHSAGAGIGLYALLGMTNQLDFHIDSEKQTEVTALVRLQPRFRAYQQGGHAVNFYHAKR